MSSLTGQQINQSYQGLLKLADSTSGITQSLQSIQDGLGNNTGLRLSINQLESPNIPSFISLKGRYYGAGFQSTAPQQLANGTQNIIIASPFYDNGCYSYSAMSYNVITATTSSDSVEVAFYTAQMLPEGLFPYEPVMSGLTLTGLTTTGVKDFTLPSDLSFSAYGAGVYFCVFKISNSGVQPTIRFGGASIGGGIGNASNILGFGKAPGVNQYSSAIPTNAGINSLVFTGTTTFDNPYPSTLPSTQSQTATINGSNFGFILHTI